MKGKRSRLEAAEVFGRLRDISTQQFFELADDLSDKQLEALRQMLIKEYIRQRPEKTAEFAVDTPFELLRRLKKRSRKKRPT